MTTNITRRGRVFDLIEANARVCLIVLAVFTSALPVAAVCGLLTIAALSEFRDVPDACWFSRVTATDAVRESNPDAWQSLENHARLTDEAGMSESVTLHVDTPQELTFWERQLRVTGGRCHDGWSILE